MLVSVGSGLGKGETKRNRTTQAAVPNLGPHIQKFKKKKKKNCSYLGPSPSNSEATGLGCSMGSQVILEAHY